MATTNMTEFRCVIWRDPVTNREVKREFQSRTQVATVTAGIGGLLTLSALNGFGAWTPFPIVETTASTDTNPA